MYDLRCYRIRTYHLNVYVYYTSVVMLRLYSPPFSPFYQSLYNNQYILYYFISATVRNCLNDFSSRYINRTPNRHNTYIHYTLNLYTHT